MAIIVFLAAIIVSTIFRHQERRHVAEQRAEYIRLGWNPPRSVPRIQGLEAILSLILGVALVVPAAVALLIEMKWGDPQVWRSLWGIIAIGTGGGVALIVLGARALISLRRYPNPE
jgi:ABC-type Fe3+ transport system permease subunit